MKNILLIHENSGDRGFFKDEDRMFNYYNEEARQVLAPNRVICPRPYEEAIRDAVEEAGVPDIALITQDFYSNLLHPKNSFNLAMETCKLGVPIVGLYDLQGRKLNPTGKQPLRYLGSRIHIFDNLDKRKKSGGLDVALENLIDLDIMADALKYQWESK